MLLVLSFRSFFKAFLEVLGKLHFSNVRLPESHPIAAIQPYRFPESLSLSLDICSSVTASVFPLLLSLSLVHLSCT